LREPVTGFALMRPVTAERVFGFYRQWCKNGVFARIFETLAKARCRACSACWKRSPAVACSRRYTDRGGHYFITPKGSQTVDKTRLTEVGRALSQLGITHIPSYSPQGRGCMERVFGTRQTAAAGIAARRHRNASGRQSLPARQLHAGLQ